MNNQNVLFIVALKYDPIDFTLRLKVCYQNVFLLSYLQSSM